MVLMLYAAPQGEIMTTRVSLNLYKLKNRLQDQLGRDVPVTEISRDTGLSLDGLYRAFKGEYNGVQFETLSRLMDYFEGKGVQVDIGEMFVVEKTAGMPGKNKPAQVELAASLA